MSTKEKKGATTSAKDQRRDANFLAFYDRKTREKLEPVFIITGPDGKPVCHLEFSMISKWDKDTEKFDYTFQNLIVKKQKVADGEFEEVVKFIIGHSDKKNALWTMVEKPDAVKAAKTAETI